MRITAPRVRPPALAGLVEADPAAALDADGTDGQRICDAALDDLLRRGVTYRETEFVRPTVAGGRFPDCRFLDVRFHGLDARELVAAGSTWRDTEVVGSRVGALDLVEGTVSGLRLDRCRLGYLGLGGAEVFDLLVEHCTIDEVDLAGATLTRVAFRDTLLRRIRVGRATLHDVDLRGAQLGEVDPVTGLRGAVLTLEQVLDLAPGLAAEVGITGDWTD